MSNNETRVSNERLEEMIGGLTIWLQSGRSGGPDLDRDTLMALTELQALRSAPVEADHIADAGKMVSVPVAFSEELREAIADAIANADVGFSMNLVRLVDGVHTYTLKYSDGETLEFCDDETDDYDAQDRLYAHVRARKRQRQADAVLCALQSKRGQP